MVPLPNFVVTGNLKEILGIAVADELVESALSQARVTFVSNFPSDAWLRWGSSLYRVKPVGYPDVRVNTNGDIVLDDGAESPVRLLAQDDGLNVRGLQWHIQIDLPPRVLPPSSAGDMRGWWINAGADGETVDLKTTIPTVITPISDVSPTSQVYAAGILDATPFARTFLTTVDDAAEARGLIGVSLVSLEDVVWFTSLAAFPATGTSDIVYGDRANGKLYLWTGAAYVAARASVMASDIIDSGTVGRSVVRSETTVAARVALGFKIVTPEDFGAVGNGVTDDSAALRYMFNNHTVINGGSTILIPYGKVYASSLPIDIKNNTFVFGGGTLKLTAFHGAGMFIQYKNAVKNVTWIGPTLDINGIENMNGHAIGDVPNTTDFVSDIHIEGKVLRTRIDKALELVNTYFDNQPMLYAGGGKGLTVQFRARNIYANIQTEDCDIGCSVEAAVSGTRYLENVVIDVQAKDSSRCALFAGGARDPSVTSLDSGSYVHSLYPGVKIRVRAQGGQGGLIPNIVSGLIDGNNWDNAGVVTLIDASGIDLEVYAATVNRCTLIRGTATASTIRVTNALMDDLQDAWDTRPVDTHPTASSFMTDTVLEANIHAKTHHGVLVRPHRNASDTTQRAMIRSRVEIDAWCQNGVGAITQSDGTTDEFGVSVVYRFRDMKASPVKEIAGFSSHNPGPQWSIEAPGGGIALAANLKADNFIPASTSTVTAAGTTTLTAGDKQTQVFTGSSTQTVKLPTVGVLAGQTWTIINNSSGSVTVQSSNASTVITQVPGKIMVYTALIDTPGAPADWQITAMTVSATAGVETLAMRDTNGNLVADNFITGNTSTATAAGVTTLDINSRQTQVFTGSATQTVLLPTTLVVAGQIYRVVNQSSGVVTVQSSAGNTVDTVAANETKVFTAQANTPTTAAHWTTGSAVAAATAATASTLAQRDSSANLTADNFIATSTSTVTAAGTTTLTIADTQVQVFTGSTTQTVKLPTTSVVTGQTYTVINNSSGGLTIQSSNGSTIITQQAGKIMVYTALIDTPGVPADWQITAMTVSATAGTETLAMRDTNGNLVAKTFIASATSTPTAAGTTTLTLNSAQTQVFTGSTTQTVLLPTTSVVAGQSYTVVNNSSGSVIVQSSGANTVATVLTNTLQLFVAQVATPTTAAHWRAI